MIRSVLVTCILLLPSCASKEKLIKEAMIIDNIPLEVFSIEKGQHANIEVLIDSHKVKLLLDTGAPSSSVGTDSFIQKYEAIDKKETKGVSGKGEFFDVIKPKEIQIGKQRLESPKFTRREDKGVVGLNILENFIFQYDLENKSLNFLDGLPKERYEINKLSSGHLTIPIKIGSHPNFGLFDTGSDATIIDNQFLQKNLSLFRVVRVENGRDHNGNVVESKVYECSKIEIGSLILENVEVVTFDFPDFLREKMEGASVILGNNIIGTGKWSFDIKNSEWTFEN